jgi:hypothetical protein
LTCALRRAAAAPENVEKFLEGTLPMPISPAGSPPMAVVIPDSSPATPENRSRRSSNSDGSFQEIEPLMTTTAEGEVQVGGDVPAAHALSSGAHVDPSQKEAAANAKIKAAMRARFSRLKSMMARDKNAIALPKEKTLSPESTFSEIEKFINGIGKEDMSYLKTVAYRLPKLGKETYDFVKSAASTLGGTMLAYEIGTAVHLPTSFVYGSQLGEIFSTYYVNVVSASEIGERPLAQELLQKWTYLKVTFKKVFDDLDEKSRIPAETLKNLIDSQVKDYTKLGRQGEVTSLEIDGVILYMMRYAFILKADSLKHKTKATVEPADGASESSTYRKRLKHFSPAKREALEEIETRILNGQSSKTVLSGPGGTGKTSLIQAQAADLKRPFKKISLTAMSVQKLRGASTYQVRAQYKTLESLTGHLALELVRMGPGIVFVDEADALNIPAMAAFWNSILSSHTLEVPAFGITLHLEEYTFYWATNVFLKEKSLMQQLSNIPFSGLTKEEKRNAANDQLALIVPAIARRSGDAVAEKVRDIAVDRLDYAAELDLMRNPGGRVIKLVMEILCGRLEENIRKNNDRLFPRKEIEQMVLDIYRQYPAEPTLDQRLEVNEREPATQLLKKLQTKIQNHADNRKSLELLQEQIAMAVAGLNENAMLLLLDALTGEEQELTLTDPNEQASALYLIGALANVVARHASEPQKTLIVLHQCLIDLQTALNNNVTDTNCQQKLLTIMHEIFSLMPDEYDMKTSKLRDDIVSGLTEWKEKNPHIAESVRDQLELITSPPPSPAASPVVASGALVQYSLGSDEEIQIVEPMTSAADDDFQLVSDDVPTAAALRFSRGAYVDDEQETSVTAAETEAMVRPWLLWLKSTVRRDKSLLDKDKSLSSESSFVELETFINAIGSEDLSYLETVYHRLPKLGRETYNVFKKGSLSLAGTMTSYAIASALNLPTAYIFGSQLGGILTNYAVGAAGAVEKGERPLGQELMYKWAYMRASLKENFDKLDARLKEAAIPMQNLVDSLARDFVRPNRPTAVTAANIDTVRVYMMRYAFILAGGSLKTIAAFQPLDDSLDESIPYLKRLKYLDPSLRKEIRDIERRIVSNMDPAQKPGLPVTKLLTGPGRTGITSLVRMQAEYLKLPFRIINLSELTLDTLRGKVENSLFEPHSELKTLVGMFALELVRMGSGIVLIDNADSLNQSTTNMPAYWKAILQDMLVLDVTSLGIPLDLSRFAFYFAMREDLNDPPLVQRLSHSRIDGLNKQEKRNAINEQMALTLPVINDRDGEEIMEKVRGTIVQWVDYIAEYDLQRFPGGGVIKEAVESMCHRLQDKFKANRDHAFSRQEIEKMVTDVYTKHQPPPTDDIRLEKDARESAMRLLESLREKSQNHARNRTALDILQKQVTQSKIGLGDNAMLLLLSALTGENQALKITDPKEQAIALDLVKSLAKVSARHAAQPAKTYLGVHRCLTELLAAWGNIVDEACRLKLLEIMRDLLSALPKDGDRRSSVHRGSVLDELATWRNDSLSEAIRAQIELLVGSQSALSNG